MGTTPARLVSPSVVLIPTTPLLFAGQIMEPSVSVPREPAVKFAETAAAEPELEPQGLASMMYGLLHCPPRPDQPLEEKKERKFAHSLRFVLPRMTAPPARSFAATVEAWSAGAPTRASEPAAVCISSAAATADAAEVRPPSEAAATPVRAPVRRKSRRSSPAKRGFALAEERTLSISFSIRRTAAILLAVLGMSRQSRKFLV